MYDLYKKIEEDISLLDRRALFALVYTAAAMALIYYLKSASVPAALLSGTSLEDIGVFIADTQHNNFAALTYWIGLAMTFYVVVPLLAIKFLFRAKPADFGLRAAIEPGFWRMLGISAAGMLPLVYLMSLTAGFSEKYPFLKIYNGEPYLGSMLLAWELIYFLQFFGLEFFFRGFLLHSLKPALGLYSVFVMTVPYTMIHFGKPMPETFAAIIAGVFLGWLSYRNGTIWMGLALHCGVALSMDIFALYQKGLLN